MAVTIYNDGSLYGDADAIYGRIGSALYNAQVEKVRQTGLQVSIVDERLNLWETIIGTTQFPNGIGHDFYLPANSGARAWTKEYWSYRGHTWMCKLGNGNIYRVRNGIQNNVGDRQIWDQTITDPTQASQWQSWSALYSGSHYGPPVVVSDGTASGKIVYHAKADGIYRNNVLRWTPASGFAIGWVPVLGQPDAGWVVVGNSDTYDGFRKLDYYWTRDLVNVTPAYDIYVNYRQARPNGSAILLSDGRIGRVLGTALHFNPRDGDHGISQWTSFQKSLTDTTHTPPFTFRGIGGGAGRNYVTGMNLISVSDGFYYLFGTEIHVDQGFDGVTSLGYGMPIWMRSKDLLHWSEPVVGPAAPNTWGFNSMVEVGGYLYWAESERVYRRPVGSVTYDISNYVPEVQFDIPRDNQAGTGSLTVANPAGVNNSIQELSDREIVVKPGLKTASGSYEFAQLDRFFTKRINRQVRGQVNRLEIEFGNLWDRLDNPLRDVFNFVGRTDYTDWVSGGKNRMFNYFFVADDEPEEDQTAGRLTAANTCLWTGWKGHNSDLEVQFQAVTGTPVIIARYYDTNNYIFLQLSASTLALYERFNGTNTLIDSWAVSADSTPKLRLQLIHNSYRVWLNGVEQIHANQFVTNGFRNVRPGYVGVSATSWTISDFRFSDWEADITIADLIRTALAMGDFHDVIIGGAESKAYAIIWGPQTDNNTPAQALRTALEANKLDLTWRAGVVEVGKFNDPSIIRTIRDTVIDSEEIDEATRRINLASVDGNEHFWLEVDTEDTRTRGRQIVGYYDIPELLDQQSVIDRSKEEIKRGAQGASPGGTTPLYFDLWRMDGVAWVDNQGESANVRIEGFSVEINQGNSPSQRQTFDTSRYPESSDSGLIDQNAATE